MDVSFFTDCIAACLGNLTTSNGEKTMFNGYVLESLVLLLEVSCTQLFSVICEVVPLVLYHYWDRLCNPTCMLK